MLLIPVASARDHPRLRGEQSTSTDFSGHIRGSPPLARGTVKPMKNKSIERRITPACAGNSHLPCRNRSHRRDHPRLRGEQQSRDLSVPQGRGSPPLARGTVVRNYRFYAAAGITPACAGNSYIYTLLCRGHEDHPRLRGEQTASAFLLSTTVGSPPLARGTAWRRA